MSRAPKFRWARADAAPLALLCATLLASCAGTPPGSEAAFFPREANVWCDSMPGTAPRAIAVMSGMLKNLTGDTLRIGRAEGFITAEPSGFAIRKFPCRIEGGGGEIRRLVLPPGDSLLVTLRTPQMPVAPFDVREYPRVRFVVRLETEEGRVLAVRSEAVKPFSTQ